MVTDGVLLVLGDGGALSFSLELWNADERASRRAASLAAPDNDCNLSIVRQGVAERRRVRLVSCGGLGMHSDRQLPIPWPYN